MSDARRSPSPRGPNRNGGGTGSHGRPGHSGPRPGGSSAGGTGRSNPGQRASGAGGAKGGPTRSGAPRPGGPRAGAPAGSEAATSRPTGGAGGPRADGRGSAGKPGPSRGTSGRPERRSGEGPSSARKYGVSRDDSGKGARGRSDGRGAPTGPIRRVSKPMDRAWKPADDTDSRAVVEWIDEGSVREAAVGVTKRAESTPAAPRRQRRQRALEDDVISAIEHAVGARKATRLIKLMAEAAAALEGDRIDDARRAITPVIREAPGVAAAREIAGQILYRGSQWRRAAAELEAFRTLRPGDVACHAVLGDCYRALGRHHEVEQLWREVKEASPSPEVMVEARIVMAGSLADRGQLDEAIDVLRRSSTVPPRVRDHHLRQWYALADLYDRAGAVVEARRWFTQIAAVDRAFVDVAERLAALGR